MDNFVTLNDQELSMVDGGRVNKAKCYVGMTGSMMAGAAGGPFTFFGGVLVGAASFCM